jgi:hypothetical protein
MNLGDLYRLATMSGMKITDDGGIEGNALDLELFSKKIEQFHRENDKFFDDDKDDML